MTKERQLQWNFHGCCFFIIELVNFQELQAYDVADLLKQYFRELPECLLTNKLSEVFINIFICKFPISSSIYKKIDNSNNIQSKTFVYDFYPY